VTRLSISLVEGAKFFAGSGQWETSQIPAVGHCRGVVGA
jgi:hypothetical protein